MSNKKAHQSKSSQGPRQKAEDSEEKAVREAVERYKELYVYSTDVLLKEHERFNRADEKAFKFSTMFIFLIGGGAYFDKWIFDGLTWADFPNGYPSHIPLIAVGITTLIISCLGLFLVHHAISLKPIYSRPLNQEVLDFFDSKTRVTIFYALAKEYCAAYELNKTATDKKHAVLTWLYRLMFLNLVFLAELVIMYCLYSWCPDA